MEMIKIEFPRTKLPVETDEDYVSILRNILFSIIMEEIRIPDKDYSANGYHKALMLIPLWRALNPNGKEIQSIIQLSRKKLDDRKQGLELIMKGLKK